MKQENYFKMAWHQIIYSIYFSGSENSHIVFFICMVKAKVYQGDFLKARSIVLNLWYIFFSDGYN